MKNLRNLKKLAIFAPDYNIYNLGVTGFDGKSRWYVSTRSEDCVLHNQVGRKINWQQ